MTDLPDTMPAVWLENRELSCRKGVPRPRPGRDEALIHIRMAGICATDLQLVKGYYPYTGIPGHEFVGTVADAPDAPEMLGQRVVGNINIACGHCSDCLQGRASHCPHRDVLGIKDHHGAMAPFAVLPPANLYRVPAPLADDVAVFAEPLAACLQILEQIQIREGDRVLVMGAGRLGQLIARTLMQTGCRLTVAARYADQRTLLEQAGISWLKEDDIPHQHYSVVVEATGREQGLTSALEAVRPTGTIVLKSTFKGPTTALLSDLVVNEIKLIGSRCGPVDKAIEWMRDGRIDPLPLIQAHYPLAEALQAFEHAASPGSMKVLIDMPQF